MCRVLEKLHYLTHPSPAEFPYYPLKVDMQARAWFALETCSNEEIRLMADVTEFSDGDFQAEVLESSLPVLVDFWAPWCNPCRMIAPIVEELAAENADKIKVGKVNIDDSPTTAAGFGVNSIPTLMIFKNG